MANAHYIPKATDINSDNVALIAFVLLLLHVGPVIIKKYVISSYIIL
jgi:hypothetical protein